MVELEIDGKKVEVPEGSMVMEAAKKVNTYIPHFCYHKKLTIAANCRMCLVEVEKIAKAVPACATPVTAGMIVKTKSEKATHAQKAVMEFLLINHPLDCPICDQGGECQLQDLAVGYGQSSSRYTEEKRVVFHKNMGPLISTEGMTRCIHCTRCVRFGQEIAGVMELGMIGRGEHAEITAFVGKTVDSELSGNMIDLCPVGALTSKPFRFSARTWELTRRKSISPHDGLGANLIVQVKNSRVMRVLPLENEAINECWLSDKDRFSYEGLNSPERLTQPMIKQKNEQGNAQWHIVDWQTALSYVADSFKKIITEKGAESIGFVGSAHSTVEELFLLKALATEMGTPHIDFRSRQVNFNASFNNKNAPWLGLNIADLVNINDAFIIGSHLREDHPLLAARLREAAQKGAHIHFLNASSDNALIPSARVISAVPSEWLTKLARIAAAVAESKGVQAPIAIDQFKAMDNEKALAQILLAKKEEKVKGVILLGNDAVHHPEFSAIHSLTSWIAEQTNSTLGFLTEAANTVGAYLMNVLPDEKGLNSEELFKQPRAAYLLLNNEPEFDSANPSQALKALSSAELVVSLTAFKPSSASTYADVLLPIAPFTETAGAFINCEGVVQTFNGVVPPLGETRPAWKVLRVLGNMLEFAGFDYSTAEEVRAAALLNIDIASSLNNETVDKKDTPIKIDNYDASIKTNEGQNQSFERLSNVPIYHADPLVRRAHSLHLTKLSKYATYAGLPTQLFKSLNLVEGDLVTITQNENKVLMSARCEPHLAESVVRVSTATLASAKLGEMHGNLFVEKA